MLAMMRCRNKQIGFTLVEMAVVLVIVGLLVGSFIGTLAGRIETTRIHNTEKEMEEIKRVLMAYAFTQTPPYLPCPDTDAFPDGMEDRNGFTGQCIPSLAGNMGVLPWVTLGLAYDDAWGMRYSYWADVNYTVNTGFNLTTDDTVGAATIETRVSDTKEDMVTNAVAVILSHGKNGYGGIDTNDNARAFPAAGTFVDEQENTDVDTTFMSRPLTGQQAATVGGEFDDILTWINSYELKAKMVETGVLPP